MTKNQMIQRVSKVIKNGGKCTIITGNASCEEDIVQLERVESMELGTVIVCRYYDPDEEINPFNEGEFAWFPTWLGAGGIIKSIEATSSKD